MTDRDFASSPSAERHRRDKGRTLAHWLYERGIGPAILHQEPAVRRAAARRAGVAPPHEEPDGAGPTWRLVAELLTARAEWDRAQAQQPPPHVPCISCAVLEHPCSRCAVPALPAVAPMCRGCGSPLDPVLTALEGCDLHPACCAPAGAEQMFLVT